MVTWLKTYHHVKEASSVGIQVGFGATILQYGTIPDLSAPVAGGDYAALTGTMFFVVIVVVNLIQLLALLDPSWQTSDPVGVAVSAIPNIIISRFLINLRQLDSLDVSEAAHSSRFSAPNFRVPTFPSILGNLGEPLAVGEDEGEELVDTNLCGDCANALPSCVDDADINRGEIGEVQGDVPHITCVLK
ncbi:hypothetical protein NM688_g4673 [Phlebia brevispora]|uniref:Uncharacterized protein n=1 Tax=Phlebia brevispora TaxID=194682 RepID=A0ACC1T2A7_9APHY|nr:hypothetical protein NM688_g4673 [Phlebia brevispora]